MENLEINKIQTLEELTKLSILFQSVFEQEYSQNTEYLQKVLENDNSWILGAYLDSKLVGGVVGFEQTPLTGSNELYIYDIAVLPQYQKRGIGTKLIEELKQKAKNKNISLIFVEADQEDLDAISFYRKNGGKESNVSHFDFEL